MSLDLSIDLPRLRRDLVRRARTDAGGGAGVIKDPVSGEFFRLQEVEGFVADQLDGETSLARVADRVAQKFGEALSEAELATFIKQLDRAGLLENERGTRVRRRSGRLAGGLLNARLKLVNPERFLNALAPRVGFFYTSAFAYLSAATILVAGMIGVLNWDTLAGEVAGLFRLSTVPLLIATVFVTITLHELAHGLTCKRFGGEVRDMGFMLLYLQPAFYCNVSDAWLFPEKSKRLLVGFAGPYFELFVWALAMLAWRVTDVDTSISQVAVVVLATSGVKTLFNFNPLIKLDGYYLLSDYLDLPNLRKRSFAYVGDWLRRLWRPSHRPAPVSAREHRIYLAYGATAWLFSFSLLSYIGLTFSEVLIAEGQRVGFIALAGLLGFRFRDKFARLFGRGRGRGSESDEASTSESKPPKKKSSNGKRVWRKALRLALKLAVAGAFVALLFVGRMELRVAGPIDVRPHHNADVRTGIAGIVEEIYVEEGQHGVTGDPIARLSDQETRAELEKTEAEIRQVRAKLAELTAGPTHAELEVARLAVITAQDRLEFATAKRARTEELFQRQLVSQQDFDVARELETTALNELAEAQGKLALLLAGTRPEQIAAAEAEGARLEAQRQYLEAQLERMNVLSPAEGMVTTPSRQLRELLRQLVPKGGLIAEVHELDVITVEAAISEKEIADVEVGQRVAVKARAYPERLFHGRVIAIGTTTQEAAAAAFAGSGSASAAPSSDPGSSIRVITEIDNESGLLKPGMTGMAKIYCGERRFIDLIMRRLSRTFRVEFWSWW